MRILTTTALALALTAGAAQAQSITYLLWGSPQEAAAWEVIVAGFEAENPGIDVTVEVADWDSYWEKLRVQMAGGTPPDVFAMDAPLFADWQSRGVLLNLQPYLDAEPALLDGVYPITMEAYRTGRRHLWPAARFPDHRAVLQQGHVRCGGPGLPQRHLDLRRPAHQRRRADA